MDKPKPDKREVSPGKILIDLDPQEYIEAFKEWYKDDIVKITSTKTDLAKFFFTVSASSMGFIATVWKVLHPSKDFPLIVNLGLLILFFSLLLSIYIFIPPFYNTDKGLGIKCLYEKTVARTRQEIVMWSLLWLIGISLSAIGTFV